MCVELGVLIEEEEVEEGIQGGHCGKDVTRWSSLARRRGGRRAGSIKRTRKACSTTPDRI